MLAIQDTRPVCLALYASTTLVAPALDDCCSVWLLSAILPDQAADFRKPRQRAVAVYHYSDSILNQAIVLIAVTSPRYLV